MTTRPASAKSGVAIAIGLALVVVTAYARFQAPAPGQNPFRISVDVALVVLQATVTDRQGSVVTNLGAQDFEVYENGVPQHIQLFKNEDIPVAVGLIIDHSTSMSPKIAEVIAAARTFVRSSNREDEMFVVNFNEAASLGLPAGIPFSDSTAELERAILNKPTMGQTALYDAIALGLAQLQAATRDKKVLIVVSDGGDNTSGHKLEQVMKLAGQSSAVIYTVGLFDQDDPDQNPGVLNHLARATGGEAFLPGELAEVPAICERIAHDIRHQYTIGYVPSNPGRDGSYRAIRVVARTKVQTKLSVRTRTGYIAGSNPQPAVQGRQVRVVFRDEPLESSSTGRNGRSLPALSCFLPIADSLSSIAGVSSGAPIGISTNCSARSARRARLRRNPKRLQCRDSPLPPWRTGDWPHRDPTPQDVGSSHGRRRHNNSAARGRTYSRNCAARRCRQRRARRASRYFLPSAEGSEDQRRDQGLDAERRLPVSG